MRENRKIGMIRTAFACALAVACLGGLAGCEASGTEGGASAESVAQPRRMDVGEGRMAAMPGYTVTLPESLGRDCRIVVNPSDEPGGSQWIGYGADVRSADDRALFFVVCCSDDWGPQGALYVEKLGASTAVPNASVYVCQARFDAEGAELENKLDEYAPLVELAERDARERVFETPYYRMQLPADLARDSAIVYDGFAREDDEGLIGHTMSVLDVQTGEPAFYVLCASGAPAPDEGQPYARGLGAPSELPEANVYVGQLMFGSDGSKPVDRCDEYASYVTVL